MLINYFRIKKIHFTNFKNKLMQKIKFTTRENRILTETYRRLNYFNNGDVKAFLLLADTPSEVKTLVAKNIITCSAGEEKPRKINWYMLTNEGQKLFKNYIKKVTDSENLQIFEGRKVINFNKPLSEQ